jgi:hypothetical protein
MRTLLLYMTTALATGAQVYWLMMWSIWGALTSRTQYVALCGSLALMLAALLAIWKARAAATTALCASVAIWSFYGPALAVTFFRLPYITLASNSHLFLQLLPSYLLALIPLGFLIASTYHAVVSLRRTTLARLQAQR